MTNKAERTIRRRAPLGRRATRAGVAGLVAAAATLALAAPASAHHADVVAEASCGASQGTFSVSFTATSWSQDDNGKHPDIEIFSGPTTTNWDTFPSTNDTGPAGSTLRAQGDFMSARSFGGTFDVAGQGGDELEVAAYARGPWSNGNAGGQVRTATVLLPDDCQTPPNPGVGDINVECTQDQLVVELTNSGDQATTATVSVNGSPVATNVAVPPGGTQVPVALDPSWEDTTVTITVDFASGTDPAPVTTTIDCTQPKPGVGDINVECTQDQLVVELTNSGDQATTATVSVNGSPVATNVAVPPGGTQVPVALDPSWEDTTVTITVDFASGTDPAPVTTTIDCTQPKPGVGDINVECTQDQLVVELTNSGDQATTATVSVNGSPVATNVAVPPGGTQVPVALDPSWEDTTVTITVDFASGTDPAPVTTTIDCTQPNPGVGEELECATGGLTVSLTNTGGQATTFTLVSTAFAGGSTQVEVGAGETGKVLLPLDEDASAALSVLADGKMVSQRVVTRDCTEVQGVSVTRTPGTPAAQVAGTALPRTGAETGPLAAMGAILMAAGALLVGLRRPFARR